MRSLSVLLCLLCSAAASAAEQYEVKLYRPDTVGRKFHIAAAGVLRNQTENTVANRQMPAKETLLAVDWIALAEILQTDDKGNATKVLYTIEKCVKIILEKEEPLIEPGKIITATAGEKKTTFELKSGKLSEQQLEALDLLAALPEPGSADSDGLYGTKEKQKIGASWPVNAAALAEDARREGGAFKPEHVAGSIKLAALEKIDGVDYLKVTGEIKVDPYSFEIPKDWKFPPQVKLTSGKTQVTFEARVPADTKLDFGSFARTYKSHLLFQGKVGDPPQNYIMETRTDIAVDMRVRPAKP